MKQMEHLEKRSELLEKFTDMKYSISAQQKIAHHIANIKSSEEAEKEAECIITLMKTKTEREVIESLNPENGVVSPCYDYPSNLDECVWLDRNELFEYRANDKSALEDVTMRSQLLIVTSEKNVSWETDLRIARIIANTSISQHEKMAEYILNKIKFCKNDKEINAIIDEVSK